MYNRRQSGATQAIAITLLLLASCAAPPARRIILVTLDTTRADHLGAYGSKAGLTPALDTLARESTVFSEASCQVPITTPSHATILTGLLPPQHGVRDNGSFVLPASARSLAEELKDRGFTTHAILASFALDRRFGLDQGFDSYDDAIGSESNPRAERRAGEVVDRALTWLTARGDEPWFLWLHLYDPHHPYSPPAPFAERFASDGYSGEIAYLDHELGRLLETLRRQQWRNTMVIVVGDHGEALGEHGERFHGTLLYDATLKVPLLVKWPGRGATGDNRTSVGTHDIFPTVIGALGAAVKSPGSGTDLRQFVGAPESGRAVYGESLTAELHYGWSRLRSLRTERLKLIDGSRSELYYHLDDPLEQSDRAAHEDELRVALTTDLDRLSAIDDTNPGTVDPEAAEKLAALGYLSAGGSSAGARRLDPATLIALENHVLDAFELETSGAGAAARIYLAVLEREPEMKLPLLRLAQLEERAGRLPEAVSWYARLLEHYPDVEVAYSSAIRLHARLGDSERSLQLAREAARMLPKSRELGLDRVDREWRYGDRDQARELLATLLGSPQAEGRAYYLRAVQAASDGENDLALQQVGLAIGRGFPPEPWRLAGDPMLASMVTEPRFHQLIGPPPGGHP